MKQTRTALTMLLGAYRSIFAHSYLKGLVAGIAATSVLAAGSASAIELSQHLAKSEEDLTQDNVLEATTPDDFTNGGHAYSLIVASGTGLTIRDGRVTVHGGPVSINGSVTISDEWTDSQLIIRRNTGISADDYYEMGIYSDVYQLQQSAESIGSGSITVGTWLFFQNGIYDLSDLNITNNGKIVLEDNATVFLPDVAALKAWSSVNILEGEDDDNESRVILTADSVSIGQDLFNSESGVYSNGGGGGLYVKDLTVTDSTLDTCGVELVSNGDVYLKVDESNTFTLKGSGQLGVQYGGLSD